MLAVMETKAQVEPPDPNDKCDHSDCPAYAVVSVSVGTGKLVFCGHHFDRLPNNLKKPGNVFDQRTW